jgi:hypothetical protein
MWHEEDLIQMTWAASSVLTLMSSVSFAINDMVWTTTLIQVGTAGALALLQMKIP